MTVNEKIVKLLKEIERENGIKILFAIENGSRAWDMASANSDFDIRFVYYRNFEGYLKLSKPKEVLNYAFTENLVPCEVHGSTFDLSGFDIFKYLHLIKSSNPTAIEWLNSHICYYGNNDLPLKKYVNENFSQLRLFFHYWGVFSKMKNRYVLGKEQITYKKYLYCFRGLLNAKFVYHFNEVPPLSFKNTVDKMKQYIPNDVYEKIREVIQIKSSGKEKDMIPHIDVFDKYFEEEIEKKYEIPEKKLPDEDYLNDFIKQILFQK